MGYQIQFTPQAQRQLRRLSQDLQARIAVHIDALSQNPRPPGCKKLQGEDKLWRIRIGDYRVIYTIEDSTKTVDVTRIAHRKEVYEP